MRTLKILTVIAAILIVLFLVVAMVPGQVSAGVLCTPTPPPPTPTYTNTPPPPTATPTETSPPPTDTPTATLPPPTDTPTATPTDTPTLTPTSTNTPTLTPTSTSTVVPTATPTGTLPPSITPTMTLPPTFPPPPTGTPKPTNTPYPTKTPTLPPPPTATPKPPKPGNANDGTYPGDPIGSVKIGNRNFKLYTGIGADDGVLKLPSNALGAVVFNNTIWVHRLWNSGWVYISIGDDIQVTTRQGSVYTFTVSSDTKIPYGTYPETPHKYGYLITCYQEKGEWAGLEVYGLKLTHVFVPRMPHHR